MSQSKLAAWQQLTPKRKSTPVAKSKVATEVPTAKQPTTDSLVVDFSSETKLETVAAIEVVTPVDSFPEPDVTKAPGKKKFGKN